MQTEPGLSTQLQAGISGLQSSLAGAQRAQDALKLYLISLGILGLPGLITMAILISQTQDQVNALQAQIKCLERQRQQQQSFSDQTRQFSGGLSDLINKVGTMGNSLQILSGDLGNVINDLDQRHLPAVRVFLTAASMEINPLLNDAS